MPRASCFCLELGGKRLDRKIRRVCAKKPANERITSINDLTLLILLAKALKMLCQFSKRNGERRLHPALHNTFRSPGVCCAAQKLRDDIVDVNELDDASWIRDGHRRCPWRYYGKMSRPPSYNLADTICQKHPVTDRSSTGFSYVSNIPEEPVQPPV